MCILPSLYVRALASATWRAGHPLFAHSHVLPQVPQAFRLALLHILQLEIDYDVCALQLE
jgi:hypothetical protein